jgi:hypothetical protein
VVIEGMVTAGGDIDIDADGNIRISAAVEAGGDLDLYARYLLTTSGLSATLTAGADVALKTRYGDIVLWGAVRAGNGLTTSSSKHCKGHKEGPDVLINSGAELYIHAAINSLDDVKIKADEGIFIDAPITAADEIKVESDGSLTTAANAVLTAGDDIELKAKGFLSIGAGAALIAGDDVKLDSHADVYIAGKVSAGDDVKVKAHCDIEVTAGIEAFDRIDLSAKDNLTLLAESILTGINGQPARFVCLHAGRRMTLDGAIKAEKLSVH